MIRVLEPELMLDPDQAKAYAEADFTESHNRVVSLFQTTFPDLPKDGHFLDLGCGPGDVTLRLARAFPQASITAVDGASAMIDLAIKSSIKDPALHDRIKWICAYVPDALIPSGSYDAIISNSLLHHLHNPSVVWNFISKISNASTRIFAADLCRPKSEKEASKIVSMLASNAPEVLQRDFFNSLCAAFTVEELQAQLKEAGLSKLKISQISDIHLAIHGSAKGDGHAL